MTARELRKCFQCGGHRVYMGEGAAVEYLPDGRSLRRADYTCLDCGARLFNYQWLVNPDAFTGPSYLDGDTESRQR